MIVKAALLLFRERSGNKELLFVRAHGKPHYVFPGGKQEQDETIETALGRELFEELAVNVVDVNRLGVVEGHTPDGTSLQMYLYSGTLVGEPVASAEIAELRWMSLDEALARQGSMTPMTLDHVFPFLSQHKLWQVDQSPSSGNRGKVL